VERIHLRGAEGGEGDMHGDVDGAAALDREGSSSSAPSPTPNPSDDSPS
jgi:hypothetical protein